MSFTEKLKDTSQQSAPLASAPRSKFQKSQRGLVHRSQIQFHPSNPRQIDPYARGKLKKIIQKRGYVGGMCWNRQTGNLVAGHQRLSILDELEGTPDYSLELDVIDVDPKKEKELLVALNNEAAQGTWDVDRLAELMPEMDLGIVGFDQLDIENLFPDRLEEFAGLFADERESDAVVQDVEELVRMKEQEKQRQRAERDRYIQQRKNQDDGNFMIHLVFSSTEEAHCFAEYAGLNPDNAFVDGRNVVNATGGSWDELWQNWCDRHKET